MTKTPWTPGPWMADITDPSDVVVWASPDPRQNDELIANVGHRVQRIQVAFDCDVANARLIAAAPDLYAAAQAVLDGLHVRIDSASQAGQPVPVFTGIADLHAALARAKGATP